MLATNIGTGLVTGQFGMGVVDGPDLDREPEVVPLAGQITFTPSIPYLPNTTATPNAITIVTAPIRGVLDEEGYLCTPSTDGVTPMYRGMRLFATDDPDASVKNWTYSVAYRFNVVNGATPTMKAHSMALPEGTEVDLTRVVEVPSSPGVGTPQALALLAQAEEAATQSAGFAEEAAAVALKVKADADAGLFDGEPGPAGPNTVPTGEAIVAAIQPGGAAHAALSGTIAAAIAEALASYEPKPEPIDAWAHWGNSMTDPSTSGNWVGKFALSTGKQHYEGGVGGESAEQITARMTGASGGVYRNRKITLEAGRNGFKTSTPEAIVSLIGSMLNHLTVLRRGFVFDVAPWSEEVHGQANRIKLDALNALIASEFPALYLPVYASLRTAEAAAYAGITFTAQDNADIANGVTPTSFRTDGGHLNDAGGTAVHHFVLKAAQERGLVAPVALHSAGASGYVDRYYPAALDPEVGTTVNLITDYADGGTPLVNQHPTVTSTVTVRNATGIGKYVQATAPYGGGGKLQKATDISGSFTFAAVVRTEALGADFIEVGGYALRRASNGQWQLGAGSNGNILANGADAWTLVIAVCAGSGSVLSINGAESGPGTITGPNVATFPYTAFGGVAAQITVNDPVEMAELITWNRVLNSAERGAVRTALKAKFPALT